MSHYAEVILPLPLAVTFTYEVPDELVSVLRQGHRVLVPFGKKKFYTAIVAALTTVRPEGYELKTIIAALDEKPILRYPQLKLWEWVAEYYLCSTGEVMKAALPAALKVESETFLELNPDFEENPDCRLGEKESIVLQILSHSGKRMSVAELERATGFANVSALASRMLEKEELIISEKLVERYVPRKVTYLRIKGERGDSGRLHEMFDKVSRARKQEQALLSLIDMSGFMQQGKELNEVVLNDLLERSGLTRPVITELERKGIVEIYKKEINRFAFSGTTTGELPVLSPAQKNAVSQLHQAWKGHEVTLLHGVTSSGKTEIYIHLIDYVLQKGRQVLYLVPEIALTTQLTGRLQKVFGEKVVIYHSKFSDNERVDIYRRILSSNDPVVIIGPRSAVFLPFATLGLVIIDEEHESSYKQQDPAPRYHARNAALVLAAMHGAKTLLGSATPSIDSYFNATTGKYGLVELTTRYGDRLMPEILTVDIKELRRKKIMKDTLFSPVLVEKLSEALGKGEQAILFQNRRGFAPVIECKDCGWVPHCVNCDVSLTYHKFRNELVCHYCGYKIQLPHQCPECQSPELRTMGFGTEMVEEEIATLFPSAKVERLDFDTARTRTAYERIIADFEKGKTQVLIGTQMLSKGLDFGNVSVVGILNADSLMNFPDFRAHERAFQLMVQVSGRSGRRDKRGTVVLQTSSPDHPLIRMVERFAYKEMVRLQLGERSMFRYPPYYRLIVIVLRSRNDSVLQELSVLYAENRRRRLGERVLGPVTPPITRVQTLHIRKIVLKIEIAAAIAPVREILESAHTEMQRYLPFKQLIVHYDVEN